MATLMDSATPFSRRRYTAMLLTASAANAVGGYLLSLASGQPHPAPLYFAGLGVFLTLGNGLLLVMYSIGRERDSYWQYRKESLRHLPFAPDPAPPAPPAPGELVYTPRGPALMNYETGIMRYVKQKGRGRPAPSPSGISFATDAATIGIVKIEEEPGVTSFAPATESMARLARYGGGEKDARLTERAWTGDGKPFSLGDFRALRDQLIDQGMAEWINPRAAQGDTRARAQGWRLRARGRAVLRAFSPLPPSPPPSRPLWGRK